MKRNEVNFYHPEINTDDLDLLIAYIKSKVPLKECVQISLDNCTIQRMESLTENSTLDDVDEVGLYPLYRILNECPNVLLASLGTIEMPGSKVSYANYSYELFCKKFWENSLNTPDAIYRDFNELEKKVEFSNLVENSQQVIGLFYLPFLLIQNILKKYKNKSPKVKFEYYLHGIIYYLDMISAFELEIAKYAFWDLTDKEIMQLPDSIRERRKFIRKNFTKEQSSFVKCKQFCINAAMDSFWLRAIAFGCDKKEHIGNDFYITDHFLATNDDKLNFIAKDIFPVRRYCDSFGYTFSVTRENELISSAYWSEVDKLSNEILLSRKYSNQESKYEEKSKKLSFFIKEIENELQVLLC